MEKGCVMPACGGMFPQKSLTFPFPIPFLTAERTQERQQQIQQDFCWGHSPQLRRDRAQGILQEVWSGELCVPPWPFLARLLP